LAGGVALASIEAVREVTRYAVTAGFDALWISQGNAVDPIVALAAIADESAALTEVGTSVVPLYGRHPIGLAQLARTAQSVLGGRFTLGIVTRRGRHEHGSTVGAPADVHARIPRRVAAATGRAGGQ
jgi:alkanesulfonate monooxygenase SsuD/methylene tetrahydromethanopterin reductase-like flavin-dependent oxidoreductase (luciferase family)